MYVINNVSTYKNSFTMDPETKWVIEVLFHSFISFYTFTFPANTFALQFVFHFCYPMRCRAKSFKQCHFAPLSPLYCFDFNQNKQFGFGSQGEEKIPYFVVHNSYRFQEIHQDEKRFFKKIKQ